MLKDTLMRMTVVTLCTLFLIYVIWLWNQGSFILVQPGFEQYNQLVYGVIIFITAYISVAYGWYPLDIPRLKRTLFFFSLIFIFVGHYVLKDQPDGYVYIADITKIIGVILFIMAPAGLLISQRVKNKRKAKKIEVIEV